MLYWLLALLLKVKLLSAFKFELDQRFLPEITLKEVNDLARKWMTESNRVVLADSPEKGSIQIPPESELAGVIGSIKSKEINAYVDEFIDQPLLKAQPQPKEIISENTSGEPERLPENP